MTPEERNKYIADCYDGFKTLLLAASIIAAVRLAREDILDTESTALLVAKTLHPRLLFAEGRPHPAGPGLRRDPAVDSGNDAFAPASS